jgi:hypothetical protein
MERIKQFDKKANFHGILSEEQIKEFENYLSVMENTDQKKILSAKLSQYNKYIEQVCPFTQLTIKDHKKPLALMSATQPHGNIVCHYDAAIKAMSFTFDNKGTLGLRIEEPPKSHYGSNDIISTGFPKEIADFVAEVENRLKSLNKMKNILIKYQHCEERYIKDAKPSPTISENRDTKGEKLSPKLWVNPNALFVHSNLLLKKDKGSHKLDTESDVICRTASL